ncbi:LuxR C-terminal-related transcriptional regulator [Pseudomonas jinjuensis]|uniref:LuxR family transcriptional regulator, maltose regulon positive regulatory protein n=1 Tax=Pseudomonas jinjuensis TaxID=198616 RepID=A0A1H0HA30_9PSED|nr:LuxR C-terminal-related transcriptional regulator [Pseudomonas jinjuensis]SDO16015.1 LuxR family transcriptional regulator, maltose regulon positive regulatory protein [Pseudomonas jinjuensis]
MTEFPTLPVLTRTPSRFFRPPLPDGHVARSRLCERMRAGLAGRLVLVSAPAGFGKSSLAIEFCEQLDPQWRSLWLGLSARDSDPGRFLERLLDGLRLYFPGLGEDAMSLLKMRQRHQPFAYEAWLDDLLDELTLRVSTESPLLLVLDDYHLAQGAVLDRCLQFLLNHLPDGLVLLVTSRCRPDWHLARLRLSRQLLELNEQDLRLSAEETAELVSLSGAQLRGPDLENLLERSEGWIAGLRLWLLAHGSELAANACDVALCGTEELIRDYLLEEVIDRLPAEVQMFLSQTARFERFSAELCDALRDAHDSAAILQHLQQHQVFLVPLDEQGQWFRYHHLFSDLLQARDLPESGPSAAALHLRACRWFSARGMLEEAVEEALRAGHPEVAASLVQSLSEEQLLAEQNPATLLRWKMGLPDSLLASSPRLIMLYGWALALACQLDAAEDLALHLARFLPAADADTQRDLLAQWQALAGVIARGRGDIEAAERHCGEALDELPQKRSGPRLLCLSTLGNLAIVRGDLWRARGLNRDALELAQRFGNPMFEALARYERARVLHARGEVFRAEEEVRLGFACLGDLSPQRHSTARGRLLIVQGCLHALALRTDEARRALQAGIDEARRCRDVSLVMGFCTLAGLEGRQGDYTRAFALLGEIERLMHVWDVPPVYYLSVITLAKCELWLAQGQVELASAWLTRLAETYTGHQPATPPECSPLLPGHVELLQALLALRLEQPEDAERGLRAVIEAGSRSGALLPVQLAQGQLLKLLLRDGREREAASLFEQCLTGAAGGALLPLDGLLQECSGWIREQLAGRAACPLLERLGGMLPMQSERLQAGGEALSGRELAVLELIAQGCSNQEISDRLFISLHTVKSHARHINDKLGVERRTQAVARAKELGLLR